jgi:hypothetical protein
MIKPNEQQPKQKFNLGALVITPGAHDALEKTQQVSLNFCLLVSQVIGSDVQPLCTILSFVYALQISKNRLNAIQDQRTCRYPWFTGGTVHDRCARPQGYFLLHYLLDVQVGVLYEQIVADRDIQLVPGVQFQ